MNANPTCRICRGPAVFIGIAGGAEASCPRACSDCASCRHPDAVLKMVQAELVERSVPDEFGLAWPASFYVTTIRCSKCSVDTKHERPA